MAAPDADTGGRTPRLAEGALPEPGTPLAVAVSGGGDSLALLHLLAGRGAGGLVALTVDHGLRPESGAEAVAVGRAAQALGVPHATLAWRGWDGRGNLMAAARAARYRLLGQWCAENGVRHVALGHTRDDDVETLFLGLARGAGLDGLSGIRPSFVRAGVTFHRPLLHLSRAALRDYLRARGVAWIDDPTNEDPGYERVRIRQALGTLGLDPARVAASIGNLRATRHDLGRELLARLEGHIRLDAGDLVLDWPLFEALTLEYRRRALFAGLRFVSGREDTPRGAAVMRLVAGDLGRAQTLHGCVVERTRDGLRIGREYAAVAGLTCPAGEVWDNRWRFAGAPPESITRALGPDGLGQWRAGQGHAPGIRPPHRTLLASPSLWREGRVLAAPMLGWAVGAGRGARLEPADDLGRLRALIAAR